MHNVTKGISGSTKIILRMMLLKSLNHALPVHGASRLFALICQNLFSTEQLFEPGQLKGSCSINTNPRTDQ